MCKVEKWKIEQAVFAELRTGKWENDTPSTQVEFVIEVMRRLVIVPEVTYDRRT